MICTFRIWAGVALALLLLARPASAEEPKKEPEKKPAAPSNGPRGFEWRHLHGLAGAAPELPKGYEVLSREPLLTTVFRAEDRFIVRLQEGTLAITVVGKKGELEVIKVLEGGSVERFGSLEKVPVEYRDKAARLFKIGEDRASAPAPRSSKEGLVPPEYREAYEEFTKRLQEAQQGAAKDKK